MPQAEKLLMTADGSCRGADFINASSRTPATHKIGKPLITLRSSEEVLFSCNQEEAAGRCLLSTKERPCAVRPIFGRKLSSENSEFGRRVIQVKGGTLDYDPTEKTIYDWPGRPTDTQSEILTEAENKLLQTLTANLYTIVSYNTLLATVWPDGTPFTTFNQLKRHIHDLREKVGYDVIETVRQRGYRIRRPDNQTAYA